MLEKVARTFDGDHEWRPQPDPTVCCLPRWVASVKAAAEYIKMNYTVSGGNYFRKNPDGSPGDDVGSIYGDTGSNPPPSRRGRNDSEVTEQDYEKARSKYYNFNTMMMNGIQNYIMQPDVNSLVGFLKNPDNDESFKEIVLRSMMREREAGEEPNDFPGHLARARMLMQSETLRRQNPESVFAKFDKLPLQEQLTILENSKVLERPLTKSVYEDQTVDIVKKLAQKYKAGDDLMLYIAKGDKNKFTIDKIDPKGGMVVSGDYGKNIVVNSTNPNAVTFNVKDPNYEMQGI